MLASATRALGLVVLLLSPLPCAAADIELAIHGYDPVAYFTDGAATKGSPTYEYVWDDERYRFATAEHRDMFRQRPDWYAPQYPGFCAMSLANGVKVEPDPENWLVRDGRLFLFGKAIGPEKFNNDLADNMARADANWHRALTGEALLPSKTVEPEPQRQ
jgi:hypothetical protein